MGSLLAQVVPLALGAAISPLAPVQPAPPGDRDRFGLGAYLLVHGLVRVL